MDVKLTFLNGGLKGEIYTSEPKDVWFLGKRIKSVSLENLKPWYEKVNSTMIQYGFVMNTSKSCVYSKLIGSNYVIKYLYVDEMLIFGTNVHIVYETKKMLSSHFEMKDIGEANVILEIKIRKIN